MPHEPKSVIAVSEPETHPLVADLDNHLRILTLERRLAEGFFILIFVLGLAGFGYYGYTANHVAPRTTLGGRNISYESRSQVAALATAQLTSYKLNLRTPGGDTVTIAPEAAGILFDKDATVSGVFARASGSPLNALKNTYGELAKGRDLPYVYTLDQSKFDHFVSEFSVSNSIDPTDGSVTTVDDHFTVAAATAGMVIDPGSLSSELTKNLGSLPGSFALPVSQVPAAVSTAAATAASNQASSWLDRSVTFVAAGKNYTPGKSERASWVMFDKSQSADSWILTPHIDRVKVGEYLTNNLGSLNNAVRVMNTDKASGDAVAAIEAGHDLSELITFVNKNSPPPQPWSKYIEINLSKQWLWAVENGQIVMDSGISSGIRATPTPTGIFHITGRLVTRDMRESDGSIVPHVPWVQYFTNEGHAIHGAYWHHDFGPTWRGSTGRSHGCVNLPVPFAEQLYYWNDSPGVGLPVWIHY